jgi:O-methyltransferase
MDVTKALKAALHRLTKNRYTICLTQILLDRPRLFNVLDAEYIRLAALELVAHEINSGNLPGDVAEVGVYQGEFARFIGAAFPHRKIYLFDTFEGFAHSQVARDSRANLVKAVDDFTDTSVNLVLNRLPHPERAIVKKGIFPETTTGLEDEVFCFVSLDCDLYEPTRDGLEFFYPRLTPGGFLFVHDFNNDLYKGVKEAVLEFSLREEVAFIPLPDSAGTAIVARPRKDGRAQNHAADATNHPDG